MNQMLRQDAEIIARAAIDAVKPDRAVKAALADFAPAGRLYLFAVGKAAWQMAKAALELPGIRPDGGIVLTKYGHVERPLEHVLCLEAGHPVPDGNSYAGTQAILDMSKDLRETDTVLFLLSGGGSALFEQPRIAPDRMEQLPRLLLASGADITEINTIRKRLSLVKGGQFAAWCAPARVYTVVLSDILGGPLDMIAGGPTVSDASTARQAAAIAEKYSLPLTAEERLLLRAELPKALPNAEAHIIGSVRQLCGAAMSGCAAMGYEPHLRNDRLACEAR
ncbi:MAG: glycerate-2-kinase family protein, partial [Clostridiales bacterium]|nr:glycerate-2-kinase family protein [Clostridiales bacterium]